MGISGLALVFLQVSLSVFLLFNFLFPQDIFELVCLPCLSCVRTRADSVFKRHRYDVCLLLQNSRPETGG